MFFDSINLIKKTKLQEPPSGIKMSIWKKIEKKTLLHLYYVSVYYVSLRKCLSKYICKDHHYTGIYPTEKLQIRNNHARVNIVCEKYKGFQGALWKAHGHTLKNSQLTSSLKKNHHSFFKSSAPDLAIDDKTAA